jgi:hypothetical protein
MRGLGFKIEAARSGIVAGWQRGHLAGAAASCATAGDKANPAMTPRSNAGRRKTRQLDVVHDDPPYLNLFALLGCRALLGGG